MKYMPSYIDSLIVSIQDGIASKGMSSIRQRSYYLPAASSLKEVAVLFCCLEAVNTWKLYDYGRSRLCPITEKEFDNIVSLTLNNLVKW